jgi:chloramphenicol 3-O-phosphotransferase
MLASTGDVSYNLEIDTSTATPMERAVRIRDRFGL